MLTGPVLQTTLRGVGPLRHQLTREFIGTTTLSLDVYVVTHHLRRYGDPRTPVVVETPDAVRSFTISGPPVRLR